MCQRKPSKTVDDNHFAAMNSIRLAISERNFAKARTDMEHLIKEKPLNSSIRNFVSMCFGVIGDSENALREALLSIVIEPQEDVAGLYYRRVAYLLKKQGKEAEAQQILKNGWEKVKDLYPKHLQAREKKKYFQI